MMGTKHDGGECTLELPSSEGASAGEWPDSVLVHRCRVGDVVAWRQLHRRYYPVAKSFLRRMGTHPEELEDACQDVFLEVFRSLPTFRGEASLKTWLYRLCVTQAGRRRRRSGTIQVLRGLLSRQAPCEPAAPAEISEQSLQYRLQQALARLNEGERAVFILYEFEAASGKQIAGVLRCPEATVWRRLHDARRKLRAIVAGDAA